MAINLPIVSKFDPTGLKQAQSAVGGFGKTLAGLGVLVAGAFSVRAISNFATEAVKMAEEAARANKILETIAETTGVFGDETSKVTDRLIKLADAQELVLGVEAEIIKETQAILLTFKGLSASADTVGGNFDRATKAAFDMATVLGTDSKSAALQLAKALEDPVKGLTALRRGGTIFTEEQQELIKTLVETGNTLEAQNLILTEVESQYGGAAEAGALWSERLRLAFEQVQEALGIALTPAFEKFASYFVTEVAPVLTKFFEEDFPRIIQDLKPVVDDIVVFFQDVGEGLKDFLNIDEDASLLQGVLDKITGLGENPQFLEFMGNVRTVFSEIGALLPGLVFNVGELAAKLSPLLEGTLKNVIPLLSDLLRIADGIDFFLGEILARFGEFEGEAPGFLDFLNRLLNPMDAVQRLARGIANAFDAAIDAFNRFKALGGFEANRVITPPGARAGRRADGGRVTGGMPYLVGEMGPELFLPGRGGNIVPNDQLGRGGGASIVINVNAGMGTNGAVVGEQIVNAIRRYERTSGPVFARA